jgi:uncharacterized phage protein gp47/JayE
LNGLDAIEVIDRDLAEDDPLRQRTLLLFCLKPVAVVAREQIRITGGVRVRDPRVEWAAVATSLPLELLTPADASTVAQIEALVDPERVIVVRVAQAGDYSRYTMHLRQTLAGDQPLSGFDQRMVDLEFSFKAECPTELDCRVEHACANAPESSPDIDYLARDYATFRRLLLDRLVQKVPDWAERTAADEGVAIVELLAYLGDQLSYRQDAVATEAYLATARLRPSLRRHVKLVDYAMHEGCNSRVFVQLQLASDAEPLELPMTGTQFLTRCDGLLPAIGASSKELDNALRFGPAIFEPLHAATLFADHNKLCFYTWGDDRCCLLAGATRATLRGKHENLKEGDWLLFEEVQGPRTGRPEDADPRKRQVVRLTGVIPAVDSLPTPNVQLTEIEWGPEDRLMFSLCISSIADDAEDPIPLRSVSVARGNLVLADHGQTIDGEKLGSVPRAHTFEIATGSSPCAATPRRLRPARFQPVLERAPVTNAVEWKLGSSASQSLNYLVTEAEPVARLNDQTFDWPSKRDLLSVAPTVRAFTLEVQNDGGARVRFGDDQYGRRPEESTSFTATYRVGNGAAGNVGAASVFHVVGADVSAIVGVSNPLPAVGGVDPESAEDVRRRAPEAFRTLERAVTTADYAALSERFPGVQRASARLRWTGSWHTMFVTVDRSASHDVDSDTRDLVKHLERYRMAGQDVAVESPSYVTLQLALHVCVDPSYFRSHVRAALSELFSARTLADGRNALFHPDNFTFGQVVYLSRLLAAARGVPGVASVTATAFGKQGDDDPTPLDTGRLLLGSREIARFDNDPNFPEFGVLGLELHGGK